MTHTHPRITVVRTFGELRAALWPILNALGVGRLDFTVPCADPYGIGLHQEPLDTEALPETFRILASTFEGNVEFETFDRSWALCGTSLVGEVRHRENGAWTLRESVEVLTPAVVVVDLREADRTERRRASAAALMALSAVLTEGK